MRVRREKLTIVKEEEVLKVVMKMKSEECVGLYEIPG